MVTGAIVGENVGTVVGYAVGMDRVGVSVVFVLVVIVGELLSICVGENVGTVVGYAVGMDRFGASVVVVVSCCRNSATTCSNEKP